MMMTMSIADLLRGPLGRRSFCLCLVPPPPPSSSAALVLFLTSASRIFVLVSIMEEATLIYVERRKSLSFRVAQIGRAQL